MPRANYRMHKEASEEVRAATEWYLIRSVEAAEGFLTAFDEALNRVLSNPQMWPAYLFDTRGLQLHRYPYVLVYLIGEQEIDILAVAHTSRRPGYWKDRRFEAKGS